ncbi:3-deoxy-7-phosphoheptulonate synthase [Streptomyces sp. NBC_00838]|uniref:3-deoxy-7-phosphoheptulonate synthase n=1 Tax=Streptomyces sp. NBC_00838 TaxID=2903680 RepID=UPI00386B5809|nr:3-deoxy-7-phosphoheptulonate synthase [Streptomyces sp. NBC_00838]
MHTGLQGQLPAAQQPNWDDPRQLAQVRAVLSAAQPLVSAGQIATLRRSLELVAGGKALILQAGDCAENPDECAAPHIAAKSRLVHGLADLLSARSGLPVIRVGRIAGQFAKPRSTPFEEIGGTLSLPAYRGHMVNAPEPDMRSRTADPSRMAMCFMTARETMGHLGWRTDDSAAGRDIEAPIWTSHEALLMDYEQPQLRRLDDLRCMLGSTHWPWIGERTRQLDGAHVALLSEVVNPVSCKVGPSTTPDELLDLCKRLDPGHEPGRLTLIVRMGADVIADRLPALVRAVRDDGRPVLWLSDPLHGNTVRRADGTKTRVVSTVVDEVRGFLSVLDEAGVPAHGLHLEASPYAVAECVGGARSALPTAVGAPSLCDPRLDPEQAAEVVSVWPRAGTPRAESVLTRQRSS